MLLKIGEFSKKTKTPIRTLRYYDSINLFKPNEVDLYTGYRYYNESQIEDLNAINMLKSVGFTLEEIKQYWNNFNDEIILNKRQELLTKIEDVSNSIRKLDYLRSNIKNGKIMKGNKEIRIKTIYK